jgi:hypothetical protein
VGHALQVVSRRRGARVDRRHCSNADGQRDKKGDLEDTSPRGESKGPRQGSFAAFQPGEGTLTMRMPTKENFPVEAEGHFCSKRTHNAA